MAGFMCARPTRNRCCGWVRKQARRRLGMTCIAPCWELSPLRRIGLGRGRRRLGQNELGLAWLHFVQLVPDLDVKLGSAGAKLANALPLVLILPNQVGVLFFELPDLGAFLNERGNPLRPSKREETIHSEQSESNCVSDAAIGCVHVRRNCPYISYNPVLGK